MKSFSNLSAFKGFICILPCVFYAHGNYVSLPKCVITMLYIYVCCIMYFYKVISYAL